MYVPSLHDSSRLILLRVGANPYLSYSALRAICFSSLIVLFIIVIPPVARVADSTAYSIFSPLF